MSNIQFPRRPLGPGAFAALILDDTGHPAIVVDVGSPFSVAAEWTVDPMSAALLGGRWEVSTYAESIGPGPEWLVGTTAVALDGSTAYSAIITVPGNTLLNDRGSAESGVYRLITMVTHRNFDRASGIVALVEHVVLAVRGAGEPTLIGSCRIDGRLVAPPSTPDLPLFGVPVRAVSANGDVDEVTTDAHGRFVFSERPSGVVDVDARTNVGTTTYIATARFALDGDMRLALRPLALADLLAGVKEYQIAS